MAPLRKTHLSATIPEGIRSCFEGAMRSRIDEIAGMADVVSEAITVIGANFAASLESVELLLRCNLQEVLAGCKVDASLVSGFMRRFGVAAGNVELQAIRCTRVAPCV